MRIESEVKLDFSNVLIKPKRSTLNSRREVDLSRTFTFKHSGRSWSGIPIMAANMDGVGTWSVARVLQQHSMFTAALKSYSLNDWITEGKSLNLQHVAPTIGVGDDELDRAVQLHAELVLPTLCIDVANGYTQRFVEFVSRARAALPHTTLIAGNVVTPEMTEELILSGADIVKVGIGPGCFAPEQKVKTDQGLKNIENIQIGEKVLTHTGSYKSVTNTFRFDDKKSIININGIKATPNHEFYVLHKKYREIVNDDNIEQYAEWIEAKNLTKDYLLLKHK